MKHRLTIRLVSDRVSALAEAREIVESVAANLPYNAGVTVDEPLRLRPPAELFAAFDEARALGGTGGRR